MRRKTGGRLFFFGVVAGSAMLFGSMLFGYGAQAGEDIRDLVLKGKPILDLRYRFEFVDQDNLTEDAKAHTVRTRAGFETGRFHGLGAGADLEWIESVGSERFNSTVNGRTQFPVVADPNDVALNQLYFLSEGTIPETRLKVGRQRIIWDDARFIGNVGFRQNEQTFDALRVGTTYLPDTDIGYTYLEEVHRIFGRDHAAGRLEMVIAHPGGSYAGMNMAFPSSVARMDWKTERPFWRPVSTTDRTAAKRWPPHWERKPLVTLRKTTLGRSARSEALLV